MQNTERESAVKKHSFKTQASKQIIADKFSFAVFIFCIFAVFSQGLLIFSTHSRLPSQIPFYYSRPWGDQMLGSPISLWILPSIAVIFAALNFFIAFFLTRENFFLLRILVVFAFVAGLATLYDVFKIVSLLV